jgi:hypothetical protein
MTGNGKVSLDDFLNALGDSVGVDGASLSSSTRLVSGLAVDSLALAHVVCVLLVDFEMHTLEDDLAEREWTHVTLGELYEEYRSGTAPPPREHIVIRSERR